RRAWAAERLREEDPYTANWLTVTGNQVIMHHSRFETDVNRAPEKAVYKLPEDAWGLNLWKTPLTEEAAEQSIQLYHSFYEAAAIYFDDLFSRHERLVVYDIHTYNHQREGAGKFANAEENPEINLGTKNMDREKWLPVVDALTQHLRSFDYDGRNLDVRENIKFKGGYFGQWLYNRYGEKVCPISIEFKKFFMDEWSGKPYEKDMRLISDLLESSRQPVLDALHKI
ncbi:MAG: N-formylglutamate amidohydrolase, partial [Pedobacter sp.]